MPFFLRPQPAFSQPEEADFLAFLSALSGPEAQSGCAQRKHCAQRREQTFTPNFDILETPAAYELYGEVPGLDKETLRVEFEDVQTLVLKGSTRRPGAFSLEKVEEKAIAEAAPEKEKEKESHNATVEDEYDAADTPLSTPSTASTSTATATEEKKQQKHAPKPKYWVSERRVGSFERKFSFSQRLEIDGVSAELRDGVLRVVVPKSQKGKTVTVSLA